MADTDGWAVPERLAEHARRFYAEGGQPVAPRVAATVVLLRPAPAGGVQVYAIRRAATMAFASGMYAFPGGSVDPRDAGGELSWVGPSDVDWAARLRLDPDRAQAVVCAAAREVFEESGVLLAGPDESTVVGDVSGPEWEERRRALVDRTLGFAGLLREQRLALRGDLLAPWARWITPEFEPRRFDTYFFLARLPAGQRTRDVGGEADHTVWTSPSAALARLAAGEIAMLPPTIVVLRELAAYSDVDSALAAAAGRDAATPVMPRLAGDRLVLR
ncbi:MAG TPA: NUDIX hydrolase [Micromonosporaceae bacterium]|nr:NUDIX hydrolase [Micromonosporaceae bacterium]